MRRGGPVGAAKSSHAILEQTNRLDLPKNTKIILGQAKISFAIVGCH